MDTVPANDSPTPATPSSPDQARADAGSSQPAGLNDLPALQADYDRLTRLYAAWLDEARTFLAHLARPDPSRCVYGCCTPTEHAAAEARETAEEFRWRFGGARAEWLAERGQP